MKQSDNLLDELFDLVDENDNLIGSIKRREAHRDRSRIHRSVSILLFNSKGELFLQKRSLGKDTYPNHWTVSASGHVRVGQTYREAAEAELSEELGICKTPTLTLITKQLIRYPNETEYQTFYFANYNGPIVINREEISQGKFFSLREECFKKTSPKMNITPELDWVLLNILPSLQRKLRQKTKKL